MSEEDNRSFSPLWAGFGFAAGMLCLVSAIGGLLAIALFSNLPLNLDCALYLGGARQILKEGVPYVDFIDMNPPGAFLVHIIPVLISDHWNLDLTRVFHALSAAGAFYSAWALWCILGVLSPAMPYPSKLARVSAIVSFAVYVAALGWLGEREYLFVVTYIPFLYIRICRHAGKAPRELTATLAGVVCAPFMLLKPHFCVAAAGVELFLCWRSGRFRSLASPEIGALVIAAALYACFFVFGPREMNEAFFGRWLPFITKYYAGHGEGMLRLNLRSIPLFPGFCPVAIGLAVVSLVLARRVESVGRLQMEALAMGTLLTYAMFLFHGKGWLYQLFPTIGLFALLAVDFADRSLELFYRKNDSFSARGRIMIILLICLGLTGSNLALATHRMATRETVNAEREPFAEMVKHHTSRGDRVLFVSHSLNPGCPVIVQTDRRPGSRYMALPLNLRYQSEKKKSNTSSSTEDNHFTLDAGDRVILDELGQDVLRLRPKMIFVDTSRPKEGGPGVTDYLDCTGWQREFMSNYRFVDAIGSYQVYLLQEFDK